MKRESKEAALHKGATDKRRKRLQRQLCDLPMDILTSILSRLPLREAIRTSALSSQWRHVWCGHTDLTFSVTLGRRYFYTEFSSSGYYETLADDEFTARVDTILRQHSGTGVQRMQVCHVLHDDHSAHLDRWVEFAATSRTRELSLDLLDSTTLLRDTRFGRTERLYRFPCRFFFDDGASGSPCLRSLVLSAVSLAPPPPDAAGFSGFRNLSRLTLVDVDVTDQDMESLMRHCKLVEFLEVAFCAMLTAIRASSPLDHLKHLRVVSCHSLERVEMERCDGLALLEYVGAVVSLAFGAAASSLRNVRVRFVACGGDDAALGFVFAGLPSTLPRLEMLSMHCIVGRERAAAPLRNVRLTHLRHFKLELIVESRDRKTDLLDYAHLLEVAPFLEILELHMWMDCPHQPYDRQKDGELRSRLRVHQHGHLKRVHLTGFFGHKDQVELALHILGASAALEKMVIDPQVRTRYEDGYMPRKSDYEKRHYVDGRRIATEFVRDTGHGHAVQVAGTGST